MAKWSLYSGFGSISAKMCKWASFFFKGKLLNLQELIRKKLNQKPTQTHTYNTNSFSAKCDVKGPKLCQQIIYDNFVNWTNRPLGKICKMQKTAWKKSFLSGGTACWSWIRCAAQFPHFNFEPDKGTFQKLLSGFCPLGGYPPPAPPTPLTENHFAKKPIAERGGPPPLNGKSAKLFWEFFS